MAERTGPSTWPCYSCGGYGFNESDGFYYCQHCGSQADDIIDTGVADEDLIGRGGDRSGAIYQASNTRRRNATIVKAEPLSQSQHVYDLTNSQSVYWTNLALDNDVIAAGYKIEGEQYTGPLDDGVGPTEPEDFGLSGSSRCALSLEDYPKELRMRYCMGLQMMIESQCEVLVRDFKVSPLICGLAATIWLRFVVASRVFADDWFSECVQESESQQQGDPREPLSKYKLEPHNSYGQRCVIVWFRSLRKKIPLDSSLSIAFLTCHIAREAILPTDIVKWSREGKLPYFAAFMEIEKNIGKTSSACPIEARVMFRPSHVVSLQRLESQAASIAQSIGLSLPPVNFYAIAYRYLNILSLPVEKILHYSCRVYEWSMPPNLWLSTNELRLPTRVCVMSILIIAIRILFNINGFGVWEESLSSCRASSLSSYEKAKSNAMSNCDMVDDARSGPGPASECQGDLSANSHGNSIAGQKSELDVAVLLHKLEARYHEIANVHECTKDLSSYLEFCNDIVFAGLEGSLDDHVEEKLIKQFWEYYQKEKDNEAATTSDATMNPKRSRDEVCKNHHQSIETKNMWEEEEHANTMSSVESSSQSDESHQSQSTQSSPDITQKNKSSQSSRRKKVSASETSREEEELIRLMKEDMAENRFYYIPPRVNIKRYDYLHYVRKFNEGALTYVAHADYYILLRACARAAQVDIRIMHIAVLNLEKRLSWLESRIDHSLHHTPSPASCEFCTGVEPEQALVDSIGLSELNI